MGRLPLIFARGRTAVPRVCGALIREAEVEGVGALAALRLI